MIRFIGWIEDAIGMVGLVAIAALVNLQFLNRFAPSPFIWTEEVSRVCMIWVAYFGCAAVTRRGLHIGVDVVTGRLRGQVRTWFLRALDILAAVIFGFVAWQGWIMIGHSRGMELVSTEWPLAVIIWPLVLGCGLSALHSVHRAVRGYAAAEPSSTVQDI